MLQPDFADRALRSVIPFGPSDLAWLIELLEVPSVSPLEGGDPAQTRRAQQIVRAGAEELGFEVVECSSPSVDLFLETDEVPQIVRDAAEADPHGFLRDQPSLVLRMGREQPEQRRLIVNFHVDTVGPHLEVTFDGRVLHGRGAVDDKGPGVAAAAGIASAFAEHPWLADEIEVRLTSVPGEEGGAMGVYGTKHLVDRGHVGRLMVFAEPSGNRAMDHCTSAMTFQIEVAGEDSTDDHPEAAHNATIALGFLAEFLARRFGPVARGLDAKLCIAGLETGTAHNRAYGSGRLLLNIAYAQEDSAQALQQDLLDLVDAAGAEFARTHRENPLALRLVDEWGEVVHGSWLKRDLPTLANRDAEMETVFRLAGLPRHDGISDGSAFTCDAIWAGAPGRYVAVCGPGRLSTNRAHTPEEFVEIADLRDYAQRIKELVVAFGNRQREVAA
ncbi:M20/M25/M40 family metallo-hydrolase [Flexivirga meconopsidis]|uniref:M20/M25/M40 family metallo-hydrolase n=1 Tax=Flexivirga meconopsidis TaxID=2977121 RepID=UPI002240DF08|nr:M20/M25/M40 family metallo-hydrolase [Flexivirga meconopsidis]